MPSTPYVIGSWVRGERFYGRASIIEEILDGPRNWLWLLGTRRIGKTSLLKQIEHLTANSEQRRYLPVFWDIQGMEDPAELGRSFMDALDDAQDLLRDVGVDLESVRAPDLFAALGNLRRKLKSKGLRLLLLCDEAEQLIGIYRRDPLLLSKLRRALQSHEDIRSVLASTIRLWALAEERGDTSPFLHGFTPPLYLAGLADNEARALIHQSNLPPENQPALDESIVEKIRQLCDNHPYLMQIVCKRYQDVGDLDEAVEQVAAEKMVGFFFAVDFDMLPQTEKDVLRIIAESATADSRSILGQLTVDPGELGGILLDLERLGYIRRDANRRFELVNFFFRRWFLERPHTRLPEGGATAGRAARAAGAPDKAGSSSQQSTRGLEPGMDVLDSRYRLIEIVGRGATGIVYKAEDQLVKEIIAIKVLKPEYCSNPDLLERCRREILLLRDLIHPNILPVHHLGESQGQRYLAMKLIDGRTLAHLIQTEGALGAARTVAIASKLASAIEAAHARRVIHRDIKPQNILLDRRGEPYLTDFGLARMLTEPGLTRGGVFLGTPDYASPEQVRLQEADERSDIYSLGVVIFEMATGRRPFIADSTHRVLEMHRDEPAPDPRHIRPDLSEPLCRVIRRCLEKDAARRYPSARELLRTLEQV